MTWQLNIVGHTDDDAEEKAIFDACEALAKDLRSKYPNAVSMAQFTGGRGNSASNLGYVDPTESMTVAELKEEAAELGVEGTSGMTKPELKEAVQEAQSEGQ